MMKEKILDDIIKSQFFGIQKQNALVYIYQSTPFFILSSIDYYVNFNNVLKVIKDILDEIEKELSNFDLIKYRAFEQHQNLRFTDFNQPLFNCVLGFEKPSIQKSMEYIREVIRNMFLTSITNKKEGMNLVGLNAFEELVSTQYELEGHYPEELSLENYTKNYMSNIEYEVRIIIGMVFIYYRIK